MTKTRMLIFCSAILLLACNEETVNSGSEGCESPQKMCDGKCVSLAQLHWKSCGNCADGYADKDGKASNGCESKTGQSDDTGGKPDDTGSKPDITCTGNEVLCGEECVNLAEKHWSGCAECADGYEDADNDASNGCESEIKKPLECDLGLTPCGEECVDLAEKHWSSCNTCMAGYEDADGNAENGCEKAAQSSDGCETGQIKCGEECVNLAEKHWSSCNTCMAGYEDADGNAENGCESTVCADKLTKCGSDCVDLAQKHWSSCNTCMSGYEDADGNAENGCENKLSNGACTSDADCKSLPNASASCKDGKCVITVCNAGYSDCDGDAQTGCESKSNADYYHCGAKGLCNADDQNSPNYKGVQCNMGQQCDNGTCKGVPEIVGCSDGTREGFLDIIRFNNIAACQGAWSVPGIHHNEGPACARKSGNHGENAAGTGCNLEDLCAEGWHVCLGRGDVQTRSEYGCNGILDGMNQNEPYLFITRTSSTGSLNCDPDTVGVPLNMNDIFGCGNFGCYATGSKCDPLKLSSHNLCSALRNPCGCSKKADGTVSCSDTTGACNGNGIGHSIDYFSALNGKSYPPAWDCGADNCPPSMGGSGFCEARDITKSQPDSQGGVMCCKNQCNQDSDCGIGLICRYNVCVECIINEQKQSEGCPAGKTCSAEHKCI